MSHLTQKAIEATFLSLLEEKPLSRITVRELSAACGINRKTFYNHYDGLDTLLEQVLLRPMEAAAGGSCGWLDAFCKLAAFLQEQKKPVLHVYACDARECLQRRLECVAMQIVKGQLARVCCCPETATDETEQEQACAFYAAGFAGMFDAWLRGRMEEDIAARLRMLERGLCALPRCFVAMPSGENYTV